MKRSRIITIAAVAAIAAMLFAIPALAQGGRDGNGDKLPDRWEAKYHLSLKVNQAPRDQDQDGLRNMGEFKQGTNPREVDTDEDGTDDNTECTGNHHGPP